MFLAHCQNRGYGTGYETAAWVYTFHTRFIPLVEITVTVPYLVSYTQFEQSFHTLFHTLLSIVPFPVSYPVSYPVKVCCRNHALVRMLYVCSGWRYSRPGSRGPGRLEIQPPWLERAGQAADIAAALARKSRPGWRFSPSPPSPPPALLVSDGFAHARRICRYVLWEEVGRVAWPRMRRLGKTPRRKIHSQLSCVPCAW